MYLKTQSLAECYGCFACQDVCPADAINFVMKKDTFLYPEIDHEKCVRCNKCLEVCPYAVKLDFHLPICSSVVKEKGYSEWLKSSSGGAFRAIVRLLVEENSKKAINTYVCGAKFSDELEVIHDLVKFSTPSSISIFQKSKYVQSNVGGIYRKVEKCLSDPMNFVIFSGTPCQVAGLYTYLGKCVSNLFTIDLFCNSVLSQKVFDQYKEGLEKVYGAKMRYYDFRYKGQMKDGTVNSRNGYCKLDNEKEIYLKRDEDGLLSSYGREAVLRRSSCSSCRFHSLYRVSDISIGDADWIGQIIPSLKGQMGFSVVLFNSQKVMKINESLRQDMDFYECEYTDFIEYCKALRCDGWNVPETMSDKTNRFYRDILDENCSFDHAMKCFKTDYERCEIL